MTDGMPARDVLALKRRGLPDMASVTDGLAMLGQLGWIRTEKAQTGKRGPTTLVVRINPNLLNSLEGSSGVLNTHNKDHSRLPSFIFNDLRHDSSESVCVMPSPERLQQVQQVSQPEAKTDPDPVQSLEPDDLVEEFL